MLYCEDDHWAPIWQRDSIAAAPGLEALELVHDADPSVEHAFVLTTAGAERMATATRRMMRVAEE